MWDRLHDGDLPALDDLDALDQERAADMVDNRPAYGRHPSATNPDTSERTVPCQTDTQR